jgi:regulator of nonsense transcripts 1
MGCKQVVMVGDHCQMGPVIVSRSADASGFGRSMFERLLQLGHRPFRLEVQYRMHPCLSEFSSNQFYEGTLQNGVTAEERDAASVFPWPNPQKPMFFYNSIAAEEIASSGTSYLNRSEAALAEKFATHMIRHGGVTPDMIGIITPYEGQRNYLVQYLNRQGPLGPEVYRRMEIASVDSFQGREKEFIILTCVRSNDQQGIGFLNDWRRLNVALTRARRGVMVIGNARVLSRHILWHALLSHFKQLNLIVDGPVLELQPIKVALQKPRLTEHAVGPQSVHGLTTMYQSSFHRIAETVDTASVTASSSDGSRPAAYFDVSYVPGIAPAHFQVTSGDLPASQETQSGWSQQSKLRL